MIIEKTLVIYLKLTIRHLYHISQGTGANGLFRVPFPQDNKTAKTFFLLKLPLLKQTTQLIIETNLVSLKSPKLPGNIKINYHANKVPYMGHHVKSVKEGIFNKKVSTGKMLPHIFQLYGSIPCQKLRREFFSSYGTSDQTFGVQLLD